MNLAWSLQVQCMLAQLLPLQGTVNDLQTQNNNHRHVLSLCIDMLVSRYFKQHTNTVRSILVQQKQAVNFLGHQMCDMNEIATARIIFAWKNAGLNECWFEISPLSRTCRTQ